MPRFLHIFSFFYNVFDAADHVEGLLGQVVILAGDDAFEAANRVLQGNVLAGGAGERLGNRERLRLSLIHI